MMVELKGSLGGIGLPALVQLIGELHHSGTLEFGRDGTQGRLAFEDGHLVAAECGDEHGLPALASVARTCKDVDFTFVEGAPSPEQTLDFGPPELKSLLQRVMNGEFAAAEQQAANHAAEVELEHPCPLLGFADDRERHYGRPTALHRCYASGAPSLVTSVEQRELCLSGRFASCPRYRNWETPPPPSPNRITEPAVAQAAVAAQQAAAVQARPAPAAPDHGVRHAPEPEAPAWIGADRPATPAAPRFRPLLPRDLGGLQFMAIGIVLGVVLVFLVFAVIVPALNSGAAQKPSSVAAPPPVVQSAPTAITQQPAPLPKPTAVLSNAPIPTAASRASVPTVVVQPSASQPAAVQPTVASGGNTQSITDVRFAQGPAKGWLDNPPFASWSDGAYRLQATQAARFVAVGVPVDALLADVLVSATFRKTGGPPGGGYGLIVRDQGPPPRDGENQDGKYYVMETGDLGDYGIWRRDGDHWVDLVPWTHSSTVRTGGSPNDLAVQAVGDHLTFVVNGGQVASITDGTLVAGGVGMFVGGDYNQVAVDRFSVALPD